VSGTATVRRQSSDLSATNDERRVVTVGIEDDNVAHTRATAKEIEV
jgi:hypothetical protein